MRHAFGLDQVLYRGFLDGSVVMKSPANAGGARDTGLIHGSGGSPRLGNHTRSSILAWEILQTEELGGSMELQRLRQNWVLYSIQFSSVQSLRHVRLFATPWIIAHQSSLSITNFQSPPKPMSMEPVMPSNHFILCHPLLFLPSIFPSIRVFSNESTLHIRWPKYWSFSFSIIPSKEIPGLISFRMDWLDLLAVNSMLMKVWHTFIPELTSALTLLQSVMGWDSLLLLELTKHDLRNLCTWCSLSLEHSSCREL